jgi:hypothetical protein
MVPAVITDSISGRRCQRQSLGVSLVLAPAEYEYATGSTADHGYGWTSSTSWLARRGPSNFGSSILSSSLSTLGDNTYPWWFPWRPDRYRLGSPVANKVMSGMYTSRRRDCYGDSKASSKIKVDPVLQSEMRNACRLLRLCATAINKAENTLCSASNFDERTSRRPKNEIISALWISKWKNWIKESTRINNEAVINYSHMIVPRGTALRYTTCLKWRNENAQKTPDNFLCRWRCTG